MSSTDWRQCHFCSEIRGEEGNEKSKTSVTASVTFECRVSWVACALAYHEWSFEQKRECSQNGRRMPHLVLPRMIWVSRDQFRCVFWSFSTPHRCSRPESKYCAAFKQHSTATTTKNILFCQITKRKKKYKNNSHNKAKDLTTKKVCWFLSDYGQSPAIIFSPFFLRFLSHLSHVFSPVNPAWGDEMIDEMLHVSFDKKKNWLKSTSHF